jgi:hypothetical protein
LIFLLPSYKVSVCGWPILSGDVTLLIEKHGPVSWNFKALPYGFYQEALDDD